MRLIFSAILAAALVFGGTLLFARYFGSIETGPRDPLDAQEVPGVKPELESPRPDTETRTEGASRSETLGTNDYDDFPVLSAYSEVSCMKVPMGEYVPPKLTVRILPRFSEGHTPTLVYTVDARFCVTVEGGASDIEVVRSDPPKFFDRAVTRAVSKWKFTPATVDGEETEVCDCGARISNETRE